MKTVIEFDNFEEEKELFDCLNGTKYKILLWDTKQLFRNTLKYDETLSEEQYLIVEKLQEKFHEIIENVELD